MQYSNSGYKAYESNIKANINNLLTDYEKHIDLLETIISDKDNEIDDLKIKNESLKEEIDELKEQMIYMRPISEYEHIGMSEGEF
ncbi:hypothetical protein HMPREF9630_00584 [Peptoanaerobacter stomatis]|uniref:Uncharacterized protein n=2 Tax=Peptoanaerobacter stomatis TaxID=796937 RepID=V9HKJ4_9FIRM|nr:hypothetical protein [Peptoanaerobacter stomatis]EHL17417.1 hypothetical protein HMPREF9630_00584 [Peptoanaerobacter stomatis]